jgi:aryl-alcohol dehydrogenase-like predicted oxidoreductase
MPIIGPGTPEQLEDYLAALEGAARPAGARAGRT